MFRSPKRVLPPGTIVQQMTVRSVLRASGGGRALEIGCGRGDNSRLLLELGFELDAFDLNAEAVKEAARYNDGTDRFHPMVADFLEADVRTGYDLVFSSMVLEHLGGNLELEFIRKVERVLRPGGRGLVLVPGSPEDWGIEDEIAGHQRRYTFSLLRSRFESAGLEVSSVAGLTYPLSNVLLPLSNFLVRRAEAEKTRLSEQERTRLSGNRDVKMKTSFASPFSVLLNEITMAPFYWLSKMARKHPRSLVILIDFSKPGVSQEAAR